MTYNRDKYIGLEIQLYPGDTVAKYGVIEDLDDLGWTIRITRVGKNNYAIQDYEVGETYFINHSKTLSFRIIKD